MYGNIYLKVYVILNWKIHYTSSITYHDIEYLYRDLCY